MDQEISEGLIERAVSNPDNKTPANLSDKTVVYFDQKAWGELREAKTNSESTDEDLYQLAKRSVIEDEFVYPFSVENLLETSSASNTAFKRDVFEAMIDLSLNNSITNHLAVLDHEAINYVCRRHELLLELDTKSFVFGKGIINVAGGWEFYSEKDIPEEVHEKIQEKTSKITKDEDFNRRLIQSREMIEGSPGVPEAEREKYVERYDEIVEEADEKPDLNDDQERAMYLTDVFTGQMMPRVREFSNEMGVNLPSIILSDPRSRSFEEFYRQFPVFYTYATLCFANDATDIDPEINDVIDITQLSVAAPHADIVVTEEFFGSMLRKFDIGETFDTTIFTDVVRFKRFLKETVE